MREIVSFQLKVHFSSRAIFRLWQQLDLLRQLRPGEHRYVLTGDCERHREPCEVWACVETNKNGEPVCTLRLPDDCNSPSP